MAIVIVMDWQRTLLFVDGRFDRVLAPGRHRYRKERSQLHAVDIRPRTTVVTGQDLLTADGITVKASVLATWTVTDPLAYVTGAVNSEQRLYSALQMAVRDAVATTAFDQLLADRPRLSEGLAGAVASETDGLGVAVSSAVVKDLMLPGELRRAATETLLAREAGKAELERARAEAASLRTLANTARLLEEHPALLHLRTLQAAATPGTTIVLTQDADKVAVAGQ